MSTLDVATFREHVTTSLGDDAIQRYIDAEEDLILERLGPVGEIVDVRFPRGERVFLLGRKPSAVTSVVERLYLVDTTLDATDYIITQNTFRRLDTGTHPWEPHTDRMTITYTAADDSDARLVATIRLVALDVAEKDAGAVVQRTVGKHAVSYSSSASRLEERNAIWEQLRAPQTPLFA